MAATRESAGINRLETEYERDCFESVASCFGASLLAQTAHLDDEIAERYGIVKARLAKLGSIIPENDIWIAATCLVHDFTLASRDAHFDSVEGLRKVRWD